MKLNELLESDDDGLNAFRKDMLNRVTARVEMTKLLVRQHDWMHEVGDMLYSSKTGKTYEITGKTMMQTGEKDPATGKRKFEPHYFYKGSDDEKGTFNENRMKQLKSLKNITRPFTEK